MGHFVKRIGDADPNPPTERVDRQELAELKLAFRSHLV
jgi:hypothetical protein